MLEVEASVKPAFNNTLTGKQKLMECIRLDGAVMGFLCALTDCALTEAVHMVLMSKQQGKISQRVSTNAFRQQHDLDRFCSVQNQEDHFPFVRRAIAFGGSVLVDSSALPEAHFVTLVTARNSS